MNYLDTTNTGGHPLYLEDLGFIQDAYKEAIAGITQGLGADSYILSGCQKTLQSPGVWHISEGFVVLDKEVFKVPAHTVTFLNENAPLYFRIQNTPFYSTPVIYKETGEKDVHFQRRAIVTTEISEYSYQLHRISSLLDRQGRSQEGTLTLQNLFEGDLRYRIIAGRCHLFGHVLGHLENQGNIICIIPPELLPLYKGEYSYATEPVSPEFSASINQSGGYIFPIVKALWNDLYTSATQLAMCRLRIDSGAHSPRTAELRHYGDHFPINPLQRIVYSFSGISWPIAPQ